ncbi:MAG: VWA domain-containing protein [bacterium]
MHLLELLASAISAESLTVTVQKSSGLTYTDGKTIYLDPSLDQDQKRDAVVLQAMLLGSGSLTKERARALLGRPGVASKYLVLEIYRCLGQYADILPSPLLNRYPKPDAVPLTGTVEESLEKASLKRLELPSLAVFGMVRPMELRKLAPSEKGGKLSDKELAGKFETSNAEEHDEETETSESKILNMFKNPLSSGDNALSRMLNEILGGGTQGGKGDDEDEGYGSVPMDRAVQTVLSNQETAQRMPGDVAPVPDVLLDLHAPFKYPEWDERNQAYIPNRTFVTEYDPWEEAEPFKHIGVDHTHHLTHQMTQVGVEYQYLRNQPSGEDFHLNALVDHAIDLSTGHSPDESIYLQSKKTRRDLSTLMLLDISSSTKDVNSQGISIHEQQAGFVEALAEALNRLGDQVAVYGFHSWGHRLVRFMRVKSFKERASSQLSRRIQQLRPSGYSRLGAAVRHGTYLLEKRRLTHHRLLLFVTDGFAYDDGYEDRYAEADTIKALEEAKSKGIAVACVSIGSDKSDAGLAKTFGETAYLRVENVNELPKRLRKHLQAAVASAAA